MRPCVGFEMPLGGPPSQGVLHASAASAATAGPFPKVVASTFSYRKVLSLLEGPPPRGSSTPVPPVPPPPARFRRSSQALSHTGKVLWGVVKTGARFGPVSGRFRDLVGFETLYWRAPLTGGPPRQCRQCRHRQVVASTFSYRKGTLGCSQNGRLVSGRFRAFSGPRRF